MIPLRFQLGEYYIPLFCPITFSRTIASIIYIYSQSYSSFQITITNLANCHSKEIKPPYLVIPLRKFSTPSLMLHQPYTPDHLRNFTSISGVIIHVPFKRNLLRIIPRQNDRTTLASRIEPWKNSVTVIIVIRPFTQPRSSYQHGSSEWSKKWKKRKEK